MNKLSLVLKVILLFFILIFIKPTVYSQSNYQEGIVITNEADTLYGFIDSKGEISLSKECSFKKDLNSEPTVYPPFSIRSFQFAKSGRYYISKVVEQNGESVPMFLEYVLEGMVDLYYYRDAWSEHYLIDKKLEDQKLIELSNEKKIIQDENGKTYSANSNKYIGLLIASFKETPSLFPKIQESPFERASFVEITKEYHNLVCEEGDKCIIYEKKQSLFNFTPGIIAGAGYNHIDMLTDGIYKDMEWTNDFSYAYGIDMNIILGIWNERLYLNTSFLKVLKTFSGEIILTDVYSSDYVNYDFLTDQLSMNLGIGYSGLKEKFQPYIQSGISINIGKVEVQQTIIKDMDTTPKDYFKVEPLHNIKDGSVYLKTGFKYFITDRLLLGTALQGYYSSGYFTLAGNDPAGLSLIVDNRYYHQYGILASVGIYFKL